MGLDRRKIAKAALTLLTLLFVLNTLELPQSLSFISSKDVKFILLYNFEVSY